MARRALQLTNHHLRAILPVQFSGYTYTYRTEACIAPALVVSRPLRFVLISPAFLVIWARQVMGRYVARLPPTLAGPLLAPR